MGKVARAIMLFVRYANKTPEASEMLEDWDRVVQFEIRGEEPFYVKSEGRRMEFVSGRHEKPNLVFKGDSDTAFAALTQKIDQDEAFQSKKFEVIGPIIDTVKFRRISDLTQEAHKPLFDLLKRFSDFIA